MISILDSINFSPSFENCVCFKHSIHIGVCFTILTLSHYNSLSNEHVEFSKRPYNKIKLLFKLKDRDLMFPDESQKAFCKIPYVNNAHQICLSPFKESKSLR